MARVFSRLAGRAFSDFLAKSVCVAKKDARIYYFKPQIFGFGILIPAFVYLSFSIGRDIAFSLLVPGLVGVVSLFGASSVEAISIPIEKQTQTYELLQTAPLSTLNIMFGKCLAGSAFGIVLSLVTAIASGCVERRRCVQPVALHSCCYCGSVCLLRFRDDNRGWCERYADSQYGIDCFEIANDVPRWRTDSDRVFAASASNSILSDPAHVCR